MAHETHHTITEADIEAFASVSGDYNPLHMDEEFAKGTIFKGRIAHGALTASYISGILGNDLPGPGAIFTDLALQFKRPVRIGDEVIARAEVSEKIEKGARVTLSCKCMVNGKTVVEGQAKVVAPRRKD
ncbi:MAG: (R)-hydratase [Ponticaulis sp.]|nr:(R)-hydratase [Ponticaulis sp.]